MITKLVKMASQYRKIIFITDLHIDTEGVFLSGRDTRDQLLRVLKQISQTKFDSIILGGDLCNITGDSKIYQWIKNQFSAYNLKVNPISGNHDTSLLMADAFELNNHLVNDALYYSITVGGIPCILLDTSTGRMDSKQWAWLENQIYKSSNDIYIFMHHPPVICNSQHMEPKHKFKEMDKFTELCQRFKDKTFHVFSGHYHLEKTVVSNNIIVYVSPSSFIQIDPESVEFRIMHPYFGYRIILLSNEGIVNTHTQYL